MTTKLQGLAQRADKLLFLMEGQAEKFAGRLDKLEERAPAAFNRGHAVLTEREGHLKDIEDFVQDMEKVGDNGGPTLDASPGASVKSGATPA